MELKTVTHSKFTPFYCALALFFSVFLFLSNSANPPNGYTGAPGDQLCTACHNPGSPPQNGNVTITGMPAMITPNATYTLTVTSENPNGLAIKAGFQMVVLNSSNQNAGSMSNNSPNTAITPSGGRTYFEHNPAVNYPGNNTLTWMVDWTAPAGPGGTTITAYVANNVANGNGSNSGDLIVTNTTSGVLEMGDPLTAEITFFEDVSCNGGSDGSATVTASNGVPPYDYDWSNGQNTATATNLSAGMYTVTVTDNTPSTATAQVTINEPPAININIQNQQNVSCNGGSDGSVTVSASGGTGIIDFSWSNGGFGAMQSGLSAGTYTVSATDDNGCLETLDINITEPDPLDLATTDIIHVACNGESTGSISVMAGGGTAPYTYEWSTGDFGPDIDNLSAGIYDLTVTDNNGCVEFFSLEVTEPDALTLEVLESQNITCNGANDGSATVGAGGGTPAYFYTWSNGGSGEMQTGLSAGTYVVTVEDQNLCTATVDVVISEPPALTLSILEQVDVDCNGNQTGSITVGAAGGTPGYTFSWSNGGSGDMQVNLGAGMYSVTVTDMNGCTATAAATIVQPEVLVANASATPESSAGANDGTATADPTGGTPGYTYTWSTGETTQTITGLSPGNYTVTVTDANGCTSMETVTVAMGGCNISASITASHLTCNGSDDGTAAVVVSGGSPPFSFNWSNGSTDSLITNLAPGGYTVTVMDNENCEATANVTITEPAAIVLMITTTGESAAGANDGTASAGVMGGTPPYTYLWSTGATTPSITDLAPGMYSVTVTDANGCTAMGSGTVNAFDCNLVISSSTIRDVSCNGGSDGAILVMTSGGTPPLTYTWSTGSTMADSLTGLSAGSYSVTITGSSSCETTMTFNIGQPEPIQVTLDSIRFTTADMANGGVFISVSGGTPPYSYQWLQGGSPVASTEDLENVDAGNYTVMVTDANGCSVESSAYEVEIIDAVIDPVLDAAIHMSPNPARTVLRITMTDYPSGEGTWILMPFSGSNIFTGSLMLQDGIPESLDVSSLPSGLYVLRLQIGDAATTRKILIQQ